MTTTAELAVPRRAGRREWLGLGVLALACLVYAMDLTVLHLAVPAISRELRPSSAELLWILDIYGFMVAGFLITMGTLGDRIGRRRVLLVGGVAFAIASVLAAFSSSSPGLIVSRAILGVAGATIAPSTLSLIFVMFEDAKQRSAAVGIWVSTFSAGSIIGPILGGLLLDRFWWGSVFLLAVPVMALMLLVGRRLLPEYRDPNAGRLDLPSVVLSLVAILSVIFGLKQAAQDGLGPLPIAAVALGLVAGGLWVRRQRRTTDPMFDLELFRMRRFSTSLVVNFLAIFMAVGYFLFVAQYMQLVLGLSPLEAALWSLPDAIAFLIAPNVAPWIVRRVRPAHVLVAGFLIAGAGMALLASVTADSPNGLFVVVAASIIISIGLGPVFGLTTELVVGSAPPERAGAATGMSETGSEVGGALGLAILGTIGLGIYRSHVVADLPAGVPDAAADAARDTLGAALDVASQLPAAVGEALVLVAQEAFMSGMRVATLIAVAISLVVAVVAFVGLRDVPPTDTAPLGARDGDATPASVSAGQTQGPREARESAG